MLNLIILYLICAVVAWAFVAGASIVNGEDDAR